MGWGKKWLVGFNAEKTQLVSLDQSNNTGAINVKMDGSVLEEKSSLRYWHRLSLLNWIEAVTLSLLLKLPPRKLEHSFILCQFFHFLLHEHAWNTAVVSGLLLLFATWNC